MPSQTQNIVDVGSKAVTVPKTVGTRDQATLKACFPDSPMYGDSPDLTNSSLTDAYNIMLVGPDVCGEIETASGLKYGKGPGLGLDDFNPNFRDAPNIADNTATFEGLEFGKGGGAPESPYVPPLTSPGPGSVDSLDQPGWLSTADNNDDFQQGKGGVEWGSGYGSTANPAATSPAIAEAAKIGGFISGKSFNNSDTKGAV